MHDMMFENRAIHPLPVTHVTALVDRYLNFMVRLCVTQSFRDPI
jgi:hypothetical protein